MQLNCCFFILNLSERRKIYGKIHCWHAHLFKLFLWLWNAFRKYCKKEIENGVKVIAVTDHVELDCESLITVINKLAKRNAEINSLEERYAISIIKGIEVSEPHLHKEAMKFFKELDLIEYIIGSIHHLNGESFRYHKDNVDEYLRSILKMVEYGEFDTVAHLDYIKKYGTTLKLDEKLIDEILNIIIEKDLTLEVNTSGYRRCGSMFPGMDILTKYSEFGGKKR